MFSAACDEIPASTPQRAEPISRPRNTGPRSHDRRTSDPSHDARCRIRESDTAEKFPHLVNVELPLLVQPTVGTVLSQVRTQSNELHA